jgi:hypothetical protein
MTDWTQWTGWHAREREGRVAGVGQKETSDLLLAFDLIQLPSLDSSPPRRCTRAPWNSGYEEQPGSARSLRSPGLLATLLPPVPDERADPEAAEW